jgi:hypothetical protein
MQEPQKEHQWLNRLVGEWTFEAQADMGPDQAPITSTGTETVRSIGGLWTVAESEGEMPDGRVGTNIMTLGFDPQAKRFVGTFIGSMMSHLWLYSGSLDASGRILTLDTEGPNLDLAAMATYQDMIEIVSDDHRILSSRIRREDGTWHQFMTAHYRRRV